MRNITWRIFLTALLSCNRMEDKTKIVRVDSADYVDVNGKDVHINSGVLHVYAPEKIIYDTCGQVAMGIFYVGSNKSIQIEGLEVQGNTILFRKNSKIYVYNSKRDSITMAIVYYEDPLPKKP